MKEEIVKLLGVIIISLLLFNWASAESPEELRFDCCINNTRTTWAIHTTPCKGWDLSIDMADTCYGILREGGDSFAPTLKKDILIRDLQEELPHEKEYFTEFPDTRFMTIYRSLTNKEFENLKKER